MERGVSVSRRDSVLLTVGNTRDRLPPMRKARFGELLQMARQRKGYSLRDLAERTGMNYSRLSRIEHGTRPAPGLAEIRTLADSLDVEMSDLLVSSGTSREVMEHLLWSQRLRASGAPQPRASGLPEWSRLLEKNTYRVSIVRRDGAVCTVRLGGEEIDAFHFGRSKEIRLIVPPEAVVVFSSSVDRSGCAVDNVLSVRVRKIRRLGQVTNLVLSGDGFELNALPTRKAAEALELSIGDRVEALIPATAIRTSPIEEIA